MVTSSLCTQSVFLETRLSVGVANGSTHNVIKASLQNELWQHMLYNLSLAQPVAYDFL